MRSRKNATERKREILERALTLFEEKGYRSVTMDMIAQSCGIARTSLYEYFRSKEEMLLSLAEGAADESHDVIPEGHDCRERMESLSAAYLERIQNNRVLYRVLFGEMPALSPEVAGKLTEWRGKHAGQLEQVTAEGIASGEIRGDVRPEDIVFLFQAVVGQRAGELLMSGEQVEPAAEGRRLCELMWRGIEGKRRS